MIKIVKKGWGYEKWIVNKQEYCGKLLFFNSGKRCSFHKHLLKDETFYLQSGKLIIRYGRDEDINKAEIRLLIPGEKFYVPIGLIHQMEAVTDCELFEFSTQHFDEDSYRIIKGD